MIFPTVQFAAFFVVVLCLSWALMPRQRLWKPFILVASYVFYGYADWRFVALLAAPRPCSTRPPPAAIAAQPTTPARPQGRLVAAVVRSTSACSGSSSTSTSSSTPSNRVLTGIGLEAPLPILRTSPCPIGISFFTFQAISYVVDVHYRAHPAVAAARLRDLRGVLPAPRRRADRPGPRVPAPARARPRDRRTIAAGPALFLIAGGLFKKVVIADLLATRIVDPVFDAPHAHSGLEVAGRDLRLRRPDLLRLLRLHRHGDRPGAAAGLPVPAELQPPVHRRARCRTSGAAGT